jgi:hypothetical protein
MDRIIIRPGVLFWFLDSRGCFITGWWRWRWRWRWWQLCVWDLQASIRLFVEDLFHQWAIFIANA